MIDPFGREISYLRVSVTDRCDFRCFYCMSEDMTFLPKAELLTLEELDRLCGAFVGLGVRKIRLLTNNPKKVVGLEGYGLEIVKQLPIKISPNEHNLEYLRAKRDKMGHKI